jgi:hypothetical protein
VQSANLKKEITLNFEAFKRWLEASNLALVFFTAKAIPDPEKEWQSLCAEAEKREPIVQYVALNKDGSIRFMARDLEYLVRHYAEYEIIKLQEVNT